MIQQLKFTEDALNYRGQWVAFSEDLQHIVGHGKTPRIALQQAEDAGEEHAVLLYIPDRYPDVWMF
jgi:predicted RNase H-like HicB family nuclease